MHITHRLSFCSINVILTLQNFIRWLQHRSFRYAQMFRKKQNTVPVLSDLLNTHSRNLRRVSFDDISQPANYFNGLWKGSQCSRCMNNLVYFLMFLDSISQKLVQSEEHYFPCTKQKESESRHFFAPRQAQGTRIQFTAAAVRPTDQKFR